MKIQDAYQILSQKPINSISEILLPEMFGKITRLEPITYQSRACYVLFTNDSELVYFDNDGIIKLCLQEMTSAKSKIFSSQNICAHLEEIWLPNTIECHSNFLIHAPELKRLYAPKLMKAGKFCNPLVYETIQKNQERSKQ